jgi:hypothetical protein
MTTAAGLVRDAFEKIGVYAPGETVNDADGQRALIVLNDMLSSWAQEYLFVYELVQTIIPTQVNQIAYPIGTTAGASINAPRPPRLQTGPGAATSQAQITTGVTSETAPLNYPILEFGGGVPGLSIGNSIMDLTNPAAIPMGTTITALGATTVTMSVGAVGQGVQTGDTIAFGTAPQPVNVVSGIEWASIVSTNLASGTPTALYYDPQYPLGVLNVAPIPDAIGQVMFEAWERLNGFTNLTTPNVNFAAGGEMAVKSNLAVMLKSYFTEAQIPPAVVLEAVTTKDMLRYTNITSRAMLRRGTPARPAA